ncbi:MAG: hypothetical protein H8F28_11070 [Fibrella sp.]|nr:hypothetical protein [Armatimonadota bacterium]
MKTTVFLLPALLFSVVAPTYAKPAVFYVAPSGNDSHFGTTAKTVFRTLPAARDAACAFRKAHPTETARLLLLPGVYALSEPLRLDGRDNNTVFGGAGKAIISGGTRFASPLC